MPQNNEWDPNRATSPIPQDQDDELEMADDDEDFEETDDDETEADEEDGVEEL